MKEEQYIIVSKTSIQTRIDELENELSYHNEWYKKAKENYDSHRKFWGQADDGEIRVASDAILSTEQEIKILKQILSQSTPLIPVVEDTFDEGRTAYCNSQDWNHPTTYEEDKQNYISNLNIKI